LKPVEDFASLRFLWHFPANREFEFYRVLPMSISAPKPAFWACDGRRGYRIMAIPIWDETYSVKVKCCDEHHQRLFAIIQRLQDSIGKTGESETTQDVLRELTEYADVHFAMEEGLLEKTNFPGIEKHCGQHQGFREKLSEFKESYENASGTLTFAMVEYLKNWLIRHIKMVDCQYSKHLNANGIQ
jgi:hemerythrin-like metal-binding protein